MLRSTRTFVILAAAVAVFTSLASPALAYQRPGRTERVSVASDGTEGYENSGGPWVSDSISADGRYVAFVSAADSLVPGDTNGHQDIFVHDRVTGATERVSVASDGTQANADSSWPAISADGRYVAFQTAADTLAPGETNGTTNVYVHDRVTARPSA